MVQEGGRVVASEEEEVGIGRLVDVKWKFGVSTCSNTCKNLNSPFVSLLLTVSDQDGNLSTHSMNLPLQEFKVRLQY